MATYLVITTPFRTFSIEVASWEDAVAKCKEMDAESTTYEAKFFEPENREWWRVRNEDGSIVWEEQ